MSHQETRVIGQSERTPDSFRDLSHFLAHHHVAVVVLTGARKGTAYPVRYERITLGRGHESDLVFDDDAMSRVHAAVEYHGGRFQFRDLDSTNGSRVNGEHVGAHDLAHGDKFSIGRHEFQFVLEPHEISRPTHIIEID